MKERFKIGKREARIPIGECPWCGATDVPLRDYLCHHSTKICCHEIFRALSVKANLTLRDFPERKIQDDEEMREYIEKFILNYKGDKGLSEKYNQWMMNIQAFQEEFGGELYDFFEYLIRVYIARGYLELKGNILGRLSNQCMVCGTDLQETWKHEICKNCMENIGVPDGDFNTEGNDTSEKTHEKRIGMVFQRE